MCTHPGPGRSSLPRGCVPVRPHSFRPMHISVHCTCSFRSVRTWYERNYCVPRCCKYLAHRGRASNRKILPGSGLASGQPLQYPKWPKLRFSHCNVCFSPWRDFLSRYKYLVWESFKDLDWSRCPGMFVIYLTRTYLSLLPNRYLHYICSSLYSGQHDSRLLKQSRAVKRPEEERGSRVG